MSCMTGDRVRYVVTWLRCCVGSFSDLHHNGVYRTGYRRNHVTTQRRNHALGGFTIIELLVVVTIFAIGSLAISATYINFTRLHRRAANSELLGEEMRFAMELIVRAARNNRIYYYSNPYPWQDDALALLDADGSWIYIASFAEGDAVCSGLNGGCLALRMEGGSWTPITGKNIDVDRFDVYVTPVYDPFTAVGIGTYANDLQPRVTIVLDANYRASNDRESASMSMQTTVSSRVYVR